jgi:site-specific DNA-methyltransferase (adenine-specific)
MLVKNLDNTILVNANCLEALKQLGDNSIDAVVCDPPYFLLNGNGDGGFMNKDWDGVANLWRHLWDNRSTLATHVENFLTSVKVERNMVEPNIVAGSANTMLLENQKSIENVNYVKTNTSQKIKGKGSVELIVVTRQGLMDLLRGLSPNLTISLENQVSGEGKSVLYAIPISLPQKEHKSIAPKIATILKKVEGCREKLITFTETETLKIKDAIEVLTGTLLEEPYMKETEGYAGCAEYFAGSMLYNVTTLSPTDREELMKWITLSLFAMLATRLQKNIQICMIDNFLRIVWKEVLRVLRPAGHALIACGTRTQHRMAVNLEDAGFEIRDVITWVYSSGFPKNKQSLKPACEFWTLCRKPLAEKTIARNIEFWGTGGLNIDDCRVPFVDENDRNNTTVGFHKAKCENNESHNWGMKDINDGKPSEADGRYPANFIHDGSDEVLEFFPKDSSRFFYCPKASSKERNAGCQDLEDKQNFSRYGNGLGNAPAIDGIKHTPEKNNHPTVKPVKLMEYLVKLITPENGVVLDPFMGSGTTGVACKQNGYTFVGVELDDGYFEIAYNRIKNN